METTTNYLETQGGVEIKENFFCENFESFKNKLINLLDLNETEIKLAKILNSKRNEVLNILNTKKLSLANVMENGEKYWLENGMADDYNYAKVA